DAAVSERPRAGADRGRSWTAAILQSEGLVDRFRATRPCDDAADSERPRAGADRGRSPTAAMLQSEGLVDGFRATRPCDDAADSERPRAGADRGRSPTAATLPWQGLVDGFQATRPRSRGCGCAPSAVRLLACRGIRPTCRVHGFFAEDSFGAWGGALLRIWKSAMIFAASTLLSAARVKSS